MLFAAGFHAWAHHATFAVEHIKMLADIVDSLFKLLYCSHDLILIFDSDDCAGKQVLVDARSLKYACTHRVQ